MMRGIIQQTPLPMRGASISSPDMGAGSVDSLLERLKAGDRGQLLSPDEGASTVDEETISLEFLYGYFLR